MNPFMNVLRAAREPFQEYLHHVSPKLHSTGSAVPRAGVFPRSGINAPPGMRAQRCHIYCCRGRDSRDRRSGIAGSGTGHRVVVAFRAQGYRPSKARLPVR